MPAHLLPRYLLFSLVQAGRAHINNRVPGVFIILLGMNLSTELSGIPFISRKQMDNIFFILDDHLQEYSIKQMEDSV
jgi:hypothetical protein